MAYESLSKTSVVQEPVRTVAAGIGEEAASAPRRSWRRALLAAGTVALGGSAAVMTMKKVSTPCLGVNPVDRDAIVSLAAVESQELRKLADGTANEDAVRQWLALATEASDHGAGRSPEELERAQEVISAAMKEKDPEKARKAVELAMDRSLMRWQGKRKDLKSYLKMQSRQLKGWRKQNSATIAECVFNVEQTVTQIAALAANIADSVQTCQDMPHIDWKGDNGKVCVVNLAGVGYSVSMIAASLSLAAENCASTLLPNYDALCAGAVSGTVSQLSQFAGAAALTSAACMPDKFDAPHPGVVPSNWGASAAAPGRRLAESVNATAQARRLVFGGGPGSTATQCYVDATSIAWWLAQAGLAINAAANLKDGNSCHMPFMKEGKLYKYAEGVCAVDALGAINGFLQAIMYLQLAVAHCSDQLNLQAMCGAGIDGMIAALSGMGAGSAGMWMNCWEAQGLVVRDNQIKRDKALQKLHRIGMLTKINGLRQEGNMGRRLSEEDLEAEVAALKQRFATPEEAWRSIGVDMSDRNAPFRKSAPAAAKTENLVGLVETPVAERCS